MTSSLHYHAFLFSALLGLLGCAVLPASGLSVEAILDRSQGAEALIDEHLNENRAVRTIAASTPESFQWPLRRMKLSSAFGPRAGGRHQGVDLESPYGTPIYATADGVVLFAGNQINGYGETVILRHRGGFASLYAHASELLVEEGQLVRRGQAIGYVGESGNATGPHLHFEIRKGKQPLDPWALVSIPKRLIATQPRSKAASQ